VQQGLATVIAVLLLSIISLADQNIRVRLFHKDKVTVEGQIQIVGSDLQRGQKVNFFLKNGEPTWRLESWFEKKPIESNKFPVTVQGTTLESSFKRLPPFLKIWPTFVDGKFKRFDVVGTFELEEYLAGVLGAEMPLSWPIEALKAQVIASRTYALKQMEKRKLDNFDVDSTVKDQVYQYDSYIPPEKRKNLTEALAQTKGIILSNAKGELVETFYHSDCGGKTDDSYQVWKFGKVGGGAVDQSCAVRLKSAWEHSVSLKDFLKKLKTELGEMSGNLLTIVTSGSSPGGRIAIVRLLFDNNNNYLISSTRLRELMGFSDVKSTRFEILVSEDKVTFKGRGFGHGVGMCQWGSKYLAEAGKSYKQILIHYFQGTQVSAMNGPAEAVSTAGL